MLGRGEAEHVRAAKQIRKYESAIKDGGRGAEKEPPKSCSLALSRNLIFGVRIKQRQERRERDLAPVFPGKPLRLYLRGPFGLFGCAFSPASTMSLPENEPLPRPHTKV